MVIYPRIYRLKLIFILFMRNDAFVGSEMLYKIKKILLKLSVDVQKMIF